MVTYALPLMAWLKCFQNIKWVLVILWFRPFLFLTLPLEEFLIFSHIFNNLQYLTVKTLRALGISVGITRDGVNDAPVLKHADVNIALSGLTYAARTAAAIIITHRGLALLFMVLLSLEKSSPALATLLHTGYTLWLFDHPFKCKYYSTIPLNLHMSITFVCQRNIDSSNTPIVTLPHHRCFRIQPIWLPIWSYKASPNPNLVVHSLSQHCSICLYSASLLLPHYFQVLCVLIVVLLLRWATTAQSAPMIVLCGIAFVHGYDEAAPPWCVIGPAAWCLSQTIMWRHSV